MILASLIIYLHPVKFCSTKKNKVQNKVPYRNYSQINWDKLGAHLLSYENFEMPSDSAYEFIMEVVKSSIDLFAPLKYKCKKPHCVPIQLSRKTKRLIQIKQYHYSRKTASMKHDAKSQIQAQILKNDLWSTFKSFFPSNN